MTQIVTSPRMLLVLTSFIAFPSFIFFSILSTLCTKSFIRTCNLHGLTDPDTSVFFLCYENAYNVLVTQKLLILRIIILLLDKLGFLNAAVRYE